MVLHVLPETSQWDCTGVRGSTRSLLPPLLQARCYEKKNSPMTTFFERCVGRTSQAGNSGLPAASVGQIRWLGGLDLACRLYFTQLCLSQIPFGNYVRPVFPNRWSTDWCQAANHYQAAAHCQAMPMSCRHMLSLPIPVLVCKTTSSIDYCGLPVAFS